MAIARVLSVGIVVLASLSIPPLVPLAEGGQVAGGALRGFALRQVTPEYPEEALRDERSGVAVALLEIGEEGGAPSVEVLESPAPSIERSMLEALVQWEFPPLTDGAGQPKRVTGKVTFYFVLRDGRGFVLNPEDAGYVGKWPQGPGTGRTPVVDVRDREEVGAEPHPGALNIPADEIEVRAPHELPGDASISVYCAGTAPLCAVGIQLLRLAGFDHADALPR